MDKTSKTKHQKRFNMHHILYSLFCSSLTWHVCLAKYMVIINYILHFFKLLLWYKAFEIITLRYVHWYTHKKLKLKIKIVLLSYLSYSSVLFVYQVKFRCNSIRQFDINNIYIYYVPSKVWHRIPKSWEQRCLIKNMNPLDVLSTNF